MGETPDTQDNKYGMEDLLQHGLEQKPIEFKQAFNDLLGQRIADAIANKRLDMSMALFADPAPEGEAETPVKEPLETETADEQGKIDDKIT